jgi:hypothetical protein
VTEKKSYVNIKQSFEIIHAIKCMAKKIVYLIRKGKHETDLKYDDIVTGI